MIRETMIDAEREESDKVHDLKLLNVLMKCIEKAIEEGNLFDDDEDDDDEDDDDDDYYDEDDDDDDESDDDNDDCVCLCDPTDIEAGYCCCNARDKKCNGKCRPEGYDRWLKSRPSYLYRILWVSIPLGRHQNSNGTKRSLEKK